LSKAILGLCLSVVWEASRQDLDRGIHIPSDKLSGAEVRG
jgi:hypothetical protein